MKRRRVGLILTALLVALCVLVSGCGKNLQAASGNSEGTESSGGISAASTENGQSGEVWESRESSGGSSGAEEPSVSPSETGAAAPNTGTATTAADRGSAATAAPTPVVTRPPAAVTTSTTVSVSILTRPKTTVGTPATTATLPPKEEAVQKFNAAVTKPVLRLSAVGGGRRQKYDRTVPPPCFRGGSGKNVD